jgi:hypothetical protein
MANGMTVDEWREAHAEPRTSFRLFGVECGEGWKHLYMPLLDLAALYGATVLQVKEKFGGLRFYFGGGGENHDHLQAMVDAAEDASFRTCENCGEHGQEHYMDGPTLKFRPKARRRSGGWIRTLCDPCAEKAGYAKEEEKEGDS